MTRHNGAYAIKLAEDDSMRILRAREVAERVGYSPMHILRLEKSGKFPRRIRLNPPDGYAVGHLESEVDEWIADRVAERDAAAEREVGA